MMGVTTDFSGVYKKLSQGNIDKATFIVANQMLVDMNENFVPMRDTALRDGAHVNATGKELEWLAPYARAQYEGRTNKAVFRNYTTPGTGPYWDKKAKGIFMSDWLEVFRKGAGW